MVAGSNRSGAVEGRRIERKDRSGTKDKGPNHKLSNEVDSSNGLGLDSL
jgi:hypothetical protein